MKLFALTLLLLGSTSQASVISENFNTRTNYSSGTAVWNQALGKVHPSLHVTNYNGGPTLYPYTVGDGSMGAFEPSTYANFSPNKRNEHRTWYLRMVCVREARKGRAVADWRGIWSSHVTGRMG